MSYWRARLFGIIKIKFSSFRAGIKVLYLSLNYLLCFWFWTIHGGKTLRDALSQCSNPAEALVSYTKEGGLVDTKTCVTVGAEIGQSISVLFMENSH